MAEDHGVGAGEAPAKAREPSLGGAGVVDHRDARPLSLDHPRGGQAHTKRRRVDVAVDGEHRGPEGLELIEELLAREVAGMEDELGFAETLETRLGQAPPPARQVGVGDDRDHPRRSTTVTSRSKATISGWPVSSGARWRSDTSTVPV